MVDDNKYEEVYENFEKSLKRLPKKDVDIFLRDRILSFIKSI
jgi:diketogulonate reductase-like aldo/keto reductase